MTGFDFYVDTSGSISDADMLAMVAEVTDIMRHFKSIQMRQALRRKRRLQKKARRINRLHR